ncbi:hypothetical protein U9M48_028514 [Paspalum notatum var. saurae]|uniref:Uncharacterized protein n=1 Tax=Paspalum notatum var. saurae TaxID=547442 RepID=A0AAQ3X126_PASNO
MRRSLALACHSRQPGAPAACDARRPARLRRPSTPGSPALRPPAIPAPSTRAYSLVPRFIPIVAFEGIFFFFDMLVLLKSFEWGRTAWTMDMAMPTSFKRLLVAASMRYYLEKWLNERAGRQPPHLDLEISVTRMK